MNANDPKRRANAITWNEADTCRKFVVPKLQSAGWDDGPHSIAEQRTFTDGRIVVRGNQTQRQKPKRADYLLRYTRDFPIAVVEAKAEYKNAADGLQQAKNYAEILDLKFAYATNGKEIIEFDYLTGIERTVENFPTPGGLTRTEVETPEVPEDDESSQGNVGERGGGRIASDPILGAPRKFYYDGGHVEIAAELVHELDADGKQLRVVKLTDYTAEKVRSLFARPEDLRARWVDAGQRADIIQQLAERGIDFATVATQAGQPEADPFDLLCHLAFNAPMLTRRQRADRLKRQHVAFFKFFAPEAREILDELLEKYAADGEVQFSLPDVLKVPPISQHGTVREIAEVFGGNDQLRSAVAELQTLLYAK